MSDWRDDVESAPEGEVVLTRIVEGGFERNVQPLKRRGSMWFLPDDSMYVYYRPTHWQSADAIAGEGDK